MIICRNLADRLSDSTSESMRELGCLAETAGAEVLGEITQNREAPDKATFVGEGKLSEISEAAETLGANLVIYGISAEKYRKRARRQNQSYRQKRAYT